MANKNELREKIRESRIEYGLIVKRDCSDEENEEYSKMIDNNQELPEGVHQNYYNDGRDLDTFYTYYEPELTQEEIMEYLKYEELKILKKIKSHTAFFVALAVISIVASLVILFVSMA